MARGNLKEIRTLGTGIIATQTTDGREFRFHEPCWRSQVELVITVCWA